MIRTRRTLLGAALALPAAACSGPDLANALAGRGGAPSATGLAYGPDPRHRLDLFRAPAPLPGAPLAVFLHGGNWEAGGRGLYRFLGAALSARGIAVAVPDYRLYPAVRYPAFLEDCALAVAWLERERAALGLAPGATALMGHSAGAYNAAMLALDRRWLAAAGAPPPDVLVGLAGPYDFLPLDTPMLRDLFRADRDPAGLPLTQPIAHAGGAGPPALLLTGEADDTVRPGNTRRLAAARRAAGGVVVERAYPGLGHLGIMAALVPALRPFYPPVTGAVVGFVAAVAAGGPPTA